MSVGAAPQASSYTVVTVGLQKALTHNSWRAFFARGLLQNCFNYMPQLCYYGKETNFNASNKGFTDFKERFYMGTIITKNSVFKPYYWRYDYYRFGITNLRYQIGNNFNVSNKGFTDLNDHFYKVAFPISIL